MIGRAVAQPWALPPLPGESEAALRERRDQAYFDQQREDSREWWRRMGGETPLAGLRVLDFGCGHGALAVAAAERGAAHVVGLDLDEARIAFARRKVRDDFPDLAGRVRFEARDIADLDDGPFDAVLSKDTFEHVGDLPAVLAHVRRLLRPGGRLLVGFSPLYYSPWGDHGRLWHPLPWLHAVLPDSLLFPLAGRRRGRRITGLADVGLNGLTPRRFRALFAPDRWRIERIRYNPGDKPLMGAMRALRRLPLLEAPFTVGIYADIVRV
ncbi:MAG: class I SAM-dependent methyltransferase [Geminicoccaceae bacterium]|nr:class I SAM-dependent methyltransferase [Geminicoccaceae bacterium]